MSFLLHFDGRLLAKVLEETCVLADLARKALGVTRSESVGVADAQPHDATRQLADQIVTVDALVRALVAFGDRLNLLNATIEAAHGRTVAGSRDAGVRVTRGGDLKVQR